MKALGRVEEWGVQLDGLLLERLRNGAAWLDKERADLYALDEVPETRNLAFGAAIDLWAGMERQLRDAGYVGCIREEGACPVGSVVLCDACAGKEAA